MLDGEPRLHPAGQTPPKSIACPEKPMTELRQPDEAELLEPSYRDARARPRTASDQQRVRGSEQCRHHQEKLRIVYQPVALGALQRYIERARRMTLHKFGFAPDIDVSIPLAQQTLSVIR